MLLGTVSITVGEAFNGSCIVAGGADILTRLAGARNGLDGVFHLLLKILQVFLYMQSSNSAQQE